LGGERIAPDRAKIQQYGVQFYFNGNCKAKAKNTDYLLSSPIKLEAGRMLVSVTSVDPRRQSCYAT